MRIAIIASLMAFSTPAAAQVRPDINDYVDRRCESAVCVRSMNDIDAGHYAAPVRNVPKYENVVACVDANQAIGKAIYRASFRVTNLEQSRGGYLSFDDAETLRVQIHNDTYFVRQTLRRVIQDGNVRQCEALRDRAFGIISHIMQDME